jgi:hypothetical protein
VTLKWRLPGGKEQQKEIVLEKGGTVNVDQVVGDQWPVYSIR